MSSSNPTSAHVQGSGRPESATSSSARFHHRTAGIECPPQPLDCVEETRHERCSSCPVFQGLEQLCMKLPTHVLAKVLDSSRGKTPMERFLGELYEEYANGTRGRPSDNAAWSSAATVGSEYGELQSRN